MGIENGDRTGAADCICLYLNREIILLVGVFLRHLPREVHRTIIQTVNMIDERSPEALADLENHIGRLMWTAGEQIQ